MLKYASTKDQRIREVNTATEIACVQKNENINILWLCADEKSRRKKNPLGITNVITILPDYAQL